MRLLVILLTMLLLVNFIGFALTNLDTRVAVRVWKTDHDKVHLITVVFLSVLAGGVYVGAIGVAEGVKEHFYAITVERRIKHPAVAAITAVARRDLFA